VLIVFSKHKGVPVLTCTRDDGSVMHSKSRHGEFFGPHDLLHYAVEATLGLRSAFFGLINQGRSVEDFDRPGAAARLPDEANHAEHMVNQLMQEERFESPRDAAEFNRLLRASVAAGRKPPSTQPPRLSQDQLTLIRARFAELLARYRKLEDGDRLELQLP
jgi:hypothetical protein